MKSILRHWTTFSSALLMAVATAHAATPAVGTGPSFKGPLGLQLYSLRGEFILNVPGTLDKVKGYGFRDVELAGTYNHAPEKFKAMLDERGLNPVSGHFSFDRYRDDIEGVIRDAKALGLRYAGCAWIPHEGEFDEAECRKAIDVFNKAGAALAGHNIKFFYHCHGYEFKPFGSGTFMDLLMRETEARHVGFEMDVFWVVHPGHDPVAWLKKYPGRWELMHVKDMKKGTPTGLFTGKSDVSNDVTVGTGVMDWAGILKAAQESGVKHYFIEDEAPTAGEQIRGSLRYLEQLRY